EEPLDVVPACRRLAGRHELVIVDCLTLWVSNQLARGADDAALLARADELAKLMTERIVSLLVVSNEVGASVHPPTAVGLRFQELLGGVNQRIAAAADRVTLMVAGIPVAIKTVSAPPGPDDRAPEAP